MSKFVKVQTQLRDLGMVKRSLDELKISYTENGTYRHIWSGFNDRLPLIINQRGTSFGLRLTEGGDYEVVGDDMQMRTIQGLVDQIQQRYAYHTVLAEVEKAGFNLVEEQTDRGNNIRLTVRRWS